VTKLEDAARPEETAASEVFREALRAVVTAVGVPLPLFEHPMRDRWMQDLFETGWMAMPAPGGGQQVMRVALRSAHVRNAGTPAPLRVESRVVFWLRGKDWAVVQQYESDLPDDMQTLNNMGNTETIPPHGDYPLGRMLRGSVESYYPDRSFSRMLEAQGQQPPVYVDTSWLHVAHVDETLAFLPASTPRGWVLLANDPALAREMLVEAQATGHGDARLFAGRQWRFGNSAEVTVSEVLDDLDVMTRSAEAAAEVEAQVAIVRAATGLGEDEIVRVPFLHHETNDKSAAYQPGTVNLLALSRTRVVAPDPHGPVIDGEDIFKRQLEEELGRLGIGVSWIDDWDVYHRHVGEVHCGTNASRAIPDVKWWEAGR
jgi:protein-arginine deiminase